MNTEVRNLRQKEWAEAYLNSKRKGILLICPRAGKIFTTINILEKFPKNCSVLITYPDSNIKASWEEDFKKRNYVNNNITWSTFASLKKHKDEKFDFVCLDEIHLLSENNLDIMSSILDNNTNVLGLTGTMNPYTEQALKERRMPVLLKYSIQEAIIEGIISDYSITIIECKLEDSAIRYSSKGGNYKTELKQFKALSWVINKFQSEDKNTFHLRLARMRLIQNSFGKIQATKDTIREAGRLLVFCGNTKVCDSLGIKSYHSKSEEKDILQKFQTHKINQLAICKLANQGVTFNKLHKVVINYTDGNSENLCQKILRCMNLDFDTPDKKAEIYIICTNEEVEKKWLSKALEFFDKNKIKTIPYGK